MRIKDGPSGILFAIYLPGVPAAPIAPEKD
jgi:hypothetical protein